MANEEVLGPRKTMFVLVIVVGCFAVLWPRILSPLVLGGTRDQLQPNQFDRDAGCCDVMFGTELTVLELINEVCDSAVINGRSPQAAAECRKTINETCGVDIAAFVKRTDNIGKSSRLLVQTMQSSNSSCLKEHFGVPVNFGPHPALTLADTIKQERPPIRGAGPHPALRERGRAIPPGAPPATPQVHIQMPPNVRVRNSPLSGYFELDIKPPPIPGMRPPLGSPGGPVPAPKSSMGFVMPIYTICIIVFFVYTISKLLFKRATIPYEPVAPDPQFRRRVFRDDSRSSPDKLVVTAISGLVAEVQQQMDAQNQQRQDAQDNTRPYTNGTIIHNSGPVHIFASEYTGKDKTPEKEPTPDPKEPQSKAALEEVREEPEEAENVESKEDKVEVPKVSEEVDVEVPEDKIPQPEKERDDLVLVEDSSKVKSEDKQVAEEKPEDEVINEPESDHILKVDELIKEIAKEKQEIQERLKETLEREDLKLEEEIQEEITEKPTEDIEIVEKVDTLIDLTEPKELKKNGDIGKLVEDFLREEVFDKIDDDRVKELIAAAEDEDDDDEQKSSVKVMGMETTAHSADGSAPAPAPPPAASPPHRVQAAEPVHSIYLETAIPQQSRVLVADCQDHTDDVHTHRHSPMVVSGKMTLSLIQDVPRDTPERDLESTVDDFTTASALTQPAEKDGSESEEEIEEEIEVEEIEEEVEEEEIEVEEEETPEELEIQTEEKEKKILQEKNEDKLITQELKQLEVQSEIEDQESPQEEEMHKEGKQLEGKPDVETSEVKKQPEEVKKQPEEVKKQPEEDKKQPEVKELEDEDLEEK